MTLAGKRALTKTCSGERTKVMAKFLGSYICPWVHTSALDL